MPSPYYGFLWRENEESMFWSFHPLDDKTNNEHLPKSFYKVIRKSLYLYLNLVRFNCLLTFALVLKGEWYANVAEGILFFTYFLPSSSFTLFCFSFFYFRGNGTYKKTDHMPLTEQGMGKYKKLFPLTTLNNNYSPKWRWLVVFTKAAKRRGKYSLATDTEVNNCFSIY